MTMTMSSKNIINFSNQSPNQCKYRTLNKTGTKMSNTELLNIMLTLNKRVNKLKTLSEGEISILEKEEVAELALLQKILDLLIEIADLRLSK